MGISKQVDVIGMTSIIERVDGAKTLNEPACS